MSALTQRPLRVYPSAAVAVNVVTGVAVGAYGAWTQITAALGSAIPSTSRIAGFTLTSLSSTTYFIQFGIGDPGEEVALPGTYLAGLTNGAAGEMTVMLPAPSKVLTSTLSGRLVARIAGTFAGATAKLAVLCYEDLDSDHVAANDYVFTGPINFGATGISVTGNTTLWANSAYGEFTTGYTEPTTILGITMQSDLKQGGSGTMVEIDLATGAAGAETVITTLRFMWQSGLTNKWLPAGYTVPAGTRIAYRVRASPATRNDSGTPTYQVLLSHVFGPLVAGSGTIAAASVMYEPAVGAAKTVTADTIAAGSVVTEPAVTVGPVTILGATISQSALSEPGIGLLSGGTPSGVFPPSVPRDPIHLRFLIDAADKTSMLGDYSISHTLGSRRNLSFGLVDYDGLYTPDIGDPVLLIIPSGAVDIREFSGSLDGYSQEKPLDGARQLKYSCTAVGLEQLADRQIVAEVYETVGQTLRDIVLDLSAKYLAADGVVATVATVDVGPVLNGRMVFPYQDLTSVFNQLGDLSGYSWWIDDIEGVRTLYFLDRTSVPAPFAVTDVNNYSVGLAINRSRAEYRNRQYVRGGEALSAVRTDILLGLPDGVRKSFDVTYPIAATPVVKVNSVTKTVGVAGHDHDVDWYWSKGQTHIEQDPAAYPLIAFDVLEVSYQWLFPLLIVYDDVAEQASRAAAEGGSGIYAHVYDDNTISDTPLLIDTAFAQVQRHRLPTTISFMTRVYGLRPGMIISAQAAGFNINAQFLVTEIRQNSIFHSYFEYLVTAVSGDATGTSWVEFYRRLAAAKREQMFRPDASSSEALLLARGSVETVACSDSFATEVIGIRESRIGFAQIGYGEIG